MHALRPPSLLPLPLLLLELELGLKANARGGPGLTATTSAHAESLSSGTTELGEVEDLTVLFSLLSLRLCCCFASREFKLCPSISAAPAAAAAAAFKLLVVVTPAGGKTGPPQPSAERHRGGAQSGAVSVQVDVDWKEALACGSGVLCVVLVVEVTGIVEVEEVDAVNRCKVTIPWPPANALGDMSLLEVDASISPEFDVIL